MKRSMYGPDTRSKTVNRLLPAAIAHEFVPSLELHLPIGITVPGNVRSVRHAARPCGIRRSLRPHATTIASDHRHSVPLRSSYVVLLELPHELTESRHDATASDVRGSDADPKQFGNLTYRLVLDRCAPECLPIPGAD